MSERKVPKIRFPGFTDDWEQRKYEDIIDLLSGQDFEPSAYNDEEMGIPYMTGASCVIDGKTIVNRWTLTPKCIANKGDVLLVCKGSGYGTLAVLSQERAHIARQFMALKSKPELNNHFNYYLAYSVVDEIKKDARGLIAGIAREAVLNEAVFIPQLEEQQRISEFFISIDNTISLLQREYDKWRKLKKGMLQKMFPKEWESVPEIRFPGFTDPWEQRKLGDVCQVTMGQSPDGSTYSDTPSDYILVQGNADLKDGWVSPRIWTTQKTKIAEAGDLIMSVRAPAGSMGKTSYNVVLGRGVAGIKGNEFIYQSLVKMDLDGYWKKLAAGSTFESINSDVVNGAELMVPQDIDEQNKIGDYFASIDTLITLHQRECDKWQTLKKALLQQMFA